jgi:hypothetical protein
LVKTHKRKTKSNEEKVILEMKKEFYGAQEQDYAKPRKPRHCLAGLGTVSPSLPPLFLHSSLPDQSSPVLWFEEKEIQVPKLCLLYF